MLAASFTMLRYTISNTSLIFDSNTTQILNQLAGSSCCHCFCFGCDVIQDAPQILPLSEITADYSRPQSDSNLMVVQCLTKTESASWTSPGSIWSYNPVRQKCAFYILVIIIIIFQMIILVSSSPESSSLSVSLYHYHHNLKIVINIFTVIIIVFTVVMIVKLVDDVINIIINIIKTNTDLRQSIYIGPTYFIRNI